MSDNPPLPTGFDLATLVETANENMRLMHNRGGARSDTDMLRELIDDHDLVYGVWQDAAEPHGVAYMMIKGRRRLEEIARMDGVAADKVGFKANVTSVNCRSAEEAMAMRNTFGDGATSH